MVVMAEIYPLHILIASLAGWMNRRQAEVLASSQQHSEVEVDDVPADDQVGIEVANAGADREE